MVVVRWKQDSEAVEGVAPFGVILGVVVQKAREAIVASWDVNGLEVAGEDLGDVFDVVVSRGACDGGGEVRCGVGKEGSCVLRRSHGVLGRVEGSAGAGGFLR